MTTMETKSIVRGVTLLSAVSRLRGGPDSRQKVDHALNILAFAKESLSGASSRSVWSRPSLAEQRRADIDELMVKTDIRRARHHTEAFSARAKGARQQI
jgi:hypothetical protein